MDVLKPSGDPKPFFRRLKGAGRRVLILDYDGTLAPFQTERDQAFPYPGVREVLEGFLEAGHTRVIVLTGRAVNDVIPLLGLRALPEIWGSHGWERRTADGAYTLATAAPRALEGLAAARAAIPPEWSAHCEAKPVSLALHWRGLTLTDAQAVRDPVVPAWRRLGASFGLDVHDFDGGLELRIPGHDKGSAVRAVLAEAGPEAMVAFLGDDLTDEAGFEALEARGLTILVRDQLRPTAAGLWLRPPEELLAFLTRWGREC